MGRSVLTLDSDVRVAFTAARNALSRVGVRVVVTSTRRTRSEQTRLWRKFQAGLAKFPVARPGTSKHETGRAIDLVPEVPARLPLVVKAMQGAGFRWAGPRDRVHFDLIGRVGLGAILSAGVKTVFHFATPATPEVGIGRTIAQFRRTTRQPGSFALRARRQKAAVTDRECCTSGPVFQLR